MITYVTKRDGKVQEFNGSKIFQAIAKSFEIPIDAEHQEELHDRIDPIYNKVIERISSLHDKIHIEKIQDIIEEELIKAGKLNIARKFIAYRNQRNIARKADTMKIFDSIIQAQANDITRENANMNADTPAGMMMKFASETTKSYVDEVLLSTDVAEAVKNNIIHIHDKDYYPTKSLTCLQHPLDKLLKNGFMCGHGEARPAKRIETATALTEVSLQAIQNEMHGGQSIPAIDFYLAPYVKMAYTEELKKISDLYPIIPKDEFVADFKKPIDEYIKKDLTGITDTYELIHQSAINRAVDRVHQAIESFIHNANIIHSRGGNQVVFSSINFGTDTSPEGRCIIREILNCTYEGVGFGSTAIFPISILKIKDGVNAKPGDPNYDLFKFACRVTARRFFPNFLNLDASYNRDDAWRPDDPNRFMHEVATMGCRTRVYGNRFGPKTSVARGNLSFTTINIVRLGLECMSIKDKEERIATFFAKLDDAIDIAARQLDERFKFQATGLAKQFPMLMNGMWLGSENLKPNDPVGPVLNQGTLSIGFIGLAECLIALVGKHHGEDMDAQTLGLSIISHMYDKTVEYSEKYEHNYTLLATPAEGLAGRFVKKDRKDFGVIEGITDKDYYTNSSHIPVYFHCTPEHKAMVEGPYHKFENAGHIFYVEMNGDATHNPEAIETIVELMRKYDIGYGSINHNRYRCLDCGFESANKMEKECPRCGSHNIDMLQRITGYLVGTTNRWNSGKLAELKDRVTHG